MLSLYRGLLTGLVVAGVAAACFQPGAARAQAKKNLDDNIIAVTTSDGLALKGYWFQGQALEKAPPDAVMMFPAPGGKINDAWIDLAQALSAKNFSVLLFDWRGCGLNGPEGQGARVFEDSERFWKEPYNGLMLKGQKGAIEKTGLDWKVLSNRSERGARYRDFLFNDLLAARFFLDKQNDARKCNTNRVWVVSEKDGAHMGLAFIAAEFQRNTKFDPKKNPWDFGAEFKPAGKDYAGLMAMSYSATNTSAIAMYRSALPSVGANERVKEALNHLEDRLAMVMMYSKREGGSASKALIASTRATGNEAALKIKFKYTKEFDTGKGMKPILGIDLIDPMDSFGAREFVVAAMVEIVKAQAWGKDPTDREAGKMLYTPRFEIEKFNLNK